MGPRAEYAARDQSANDKLSTKSLSISCRARHDAQSGVTAAAVLERANATTTGNTCVRLGIAFYKYFDVKHSGPIRNVNSLDRLRFDIGLGHIESLTSLLVFVRGRSKHSQYSLYDYESGTPLPFFVGAASQLDKNSETQGGDDWMHKCRPRDAVLTASPHRPTLKRAIGYRPAAPTTVSTIDGFTRRTSDARRRLTDRRERPCSNSNFSPA